MQLPSPICEFNENGDCKDCASVWSRHEVVRSHAEVEPSVVQLQNAHNLNLVASVMLIHKLASLKLELTNLIVLHFIYPFFFFLMYDKNSSHLLCWAQFLI